MSNLGREQREKLERIIREELQKEGFLDRVMSKAKGNMSALKQLGSNTTQGIRAITTGQIDPSKVKDPKIVKGVTVAVERIKQYDKKFFKLLQDMTQDLMLMFGPDYKKYPELVQALEKVDKVSETFAQSLKDIGTDVQKITTGGGGTSAEPSATQSAQSEPAQPPEPEKPAGSKPLTNFKSMYDNPPQDKDTADKINQAKQYQYKKLARRRAKEEGQE